MVAGTVIIPHNGSDAVPHSPSSGRSKNMADHTFFLDLYIIFIISKVDIPNNSAGPVSI